MFAQRKDDQVGISVADAMFGHRYRTSQALAGKPSGASEVVIEATYRAVLAPWLSVQPDVQYVVSPSGDLHLPDATVVGLRIKIGQ
jgi:porin